MQQSRHPLEQCIRRLGEYGCCLFVRTQKMKTKQGCSPASNEQRTKPNQTSALLSCSWSSLTSAHPRAEPIEVFSLPLDLRPLPVKNAPGSLGRCLCLLTVVFELLNQQSTKQ